jgi:hypothetical protein
VLARSKWKAKESFEHFQETLNWNWLFFRKEIFRQKHTTSETYLLISLLVDWQRIISYASFTGYQSYIMSLLLFFVQSSQLEFKRLNISSLIRSNVT